MDKIFDRIKAYSNGCINGEIAACKKHKNACLRFLKDAEAMASGKSPYYWDEEAAEEIVSQLGKPVFQCLIDITEKQEQTGRIVFRIDPDIGDLSAVMGILYVNGAVAGAAHLHVLVPAQ